LPRDRGHAPVARPLPGKLAAYGLPALLALSCPLHAHEAHVHGTARLEVAVEGPTLSIELRSPLANLVGFEHAPTDAAQRQAVATMRSRLHDPATLFQPPAAADCRTKAAEVELPFELATGATAHRPPDHAGEGHLDVGATYELVCAHPENLRFLDVLVFDTFPGVRTIEAAVAGPRGQSASVLARDRRRVRF
jgi:hypothetical protein